MQESSVPSLGCDAVLSGGMLLAENGAPL